MKKKDKLINTIFVLLILAGFCLLLYPTVSDYWNSFHSSQAIQGYVTQVDNIDREKYEQIWNDAVEYNESLLTRKNHYLLSDKQRETYLSLFNIDVTGIIGYIEIPAINCMLPFYHSTEESVLSTAVGHLEWTSLPTGGESTHCVLSAHRGLPSAKLFTDLDRMTTGDIFMLHVLDKTLTYSVDQILIVEPHEVEALHIQDGEDLCTLVTCTPYGINSHRLLVRGHRVENIDDKIIHVTADAVQIEPVWVATVIAMPILIILFIIAVLPKKSHRKTERSDV